MCICVRWYCMSCIVLSTYLPTYLPTRLTYLPTYLTDLPYLSSYLPTYRPTLHKCPAMVPKAILSGTETPTIVICMYRVVLDSQRTMGPLDFACGLWATPLAKRPWTRLNLGLSSTSGCAAPLPPTRWPRNVFDCSATCTFEHIQQATFSYSTGTAAK